MEMVLVSVAKAGELAEGQGKVVKANGMELALFKSGGNFYCISNTCRHRGGPLGEGDLEGKVVTCPFHGWQYDITSGQCINMPMEHVARFNVFVEGDDVKVDI